MSKIVKYILINAPVEKVFEYLSDPMNMLDWHPNVIGIRDVNGCGEKQNWTWNYKLLGFTFTGEVQVVKSIINTERTIKSTGGIWSERTWRFKKEAGGTRLDYILEYTVPNSIISKLGEFIAIQRSERVVNTALTNIKEKMEG